jgi:serine/threonine-protein kinase RsbW
VADGALTVRTKATFRAHLPAFAEVRVWTEAFGAAVGSGRGAVLRLVLILEELFTNSVTHGYGGKDEGPIWIALSSRGDSIEVTYEDAGPPFDPFTPSPSSGAAPRSSDAPPGGLGLALVRGLCVAPRYARIDGRNRITLTVPPESPATGMG